MKAHKQRKLEEMVKKSIVCSLIAMVTFFFMGLGQYQAKNPIQGVVKGSVLNTKYVQFYKDNGLIPIP